MQKVFENFLEKISLKKKEQKIRTRKSLWRRRQMADLYILFIQREEQKC